MRFQKKKILQNTFIFIYQMLLLLQSHLFTDHGNIRSDVHQNSGHRFRGKYLTANNYIKSVLTQQK